MITYKGEQYYTSAEAAAVLGVNPETVRQLVYRKRFLPLRLGGRVYIKDSIVHTYRPRIRRLPAFELQPPEVINQPMRSLEDTMRAWKYSRAYLRRLIRDDRLEAYCTAEGVILITQKSIDNFINRGNETKHGQYADL